MSLILMGQLAITEKDITFTFFDDAYDEGLDNDASAFETIIITLDGE